MFEPLDKNNILGFDTETGLRYTASDTALISISHKMDRKYHIYDYADILDCWEAVLVCWNELQKDPELLAEYKKLSGDNALGNYIKQYALDFLYKTDKLTNYDVISKITYPRFACVLGTDFENIRDFNRAEDIFRSKARLNFVLKDHSEDFIKYIVKRINHGDNIAIITFNLEYDFNTLMCNVDPTLLHRLHIIDERLPTKIHADKTITWKSESKKCKGCCKWVDAMLLSEKGMSISRYGSMASSIYNKDLHKLESYDYDFIVHSARDLKPTPEELKYCYRDVQLAIWGLSYLLRNHVATLNKCNLLKKPSDLPITCSHLYDMVNVINTLNVDMHYSATRRRKYFNSYKRKTARYNEEHCNPPDLELYNYFKKGFGGGKIAFNPLHLEEKIKGGAGYSLDLCSAYPYQIVNRFPDMAELYIMDDDYFNKEVIKAWDIADKMNRGEYVNLIPLYNYGFTARIRITGLKLRKDMQLPIIGEHDGNVKLTDPVMIRNRVMAASCAVMSVTHADLITILAAYDIENIELIDGYVYKLVPMNTNLRRKFVAAANFKSGIKKFMKLPFKNFPVESFNEFVGQDILSKNDSEAEHIQKLKDCYQNSKVLFNGIYGKACQSLIHSKKFIDENGEISITLDEYKARQGTCYTTGRYIATYTRFHLVNLYFIALRCIGPEDLILYAHTDSLKIYLYSADHAEIIKKIINKYNEGILEECRTFFKNGMKIHNKVSEAEYKLAYETLINNGLGLVEDELDNRFDKVIVCGNMRILTQKDNKCHLTFSGVNIPYVLSGGKENYKPDELERYVNKEGIFNLYDKWFCTGRQYTIYESCKTTLDYKHYNMLLNPKLGHICQTIKEMPIEINGDLEKLKRDSINIKYWKEYVNNA